MSRWKAALVMPTRNRLRSKLESGRGDLSESGEQPRKERVDAENSFGLRYAGRREGWSKVLQLKHPGTSLKGNGKDAPEKIGG